MGQVRALVAAAAVLVIVVPSAGPAEAAGDGSYPRPGRTELIAVSQEDPGGHPTISADGRSVAFDESRGGTSQVFVFDRHTADSQQVSVAPDGTPGGRASMGATISGNGRHVAFASDATNLVAGDTNGKRDVFVRDLDTGTTERVSVSSGGDQGNNDASYEALVTELAISADGRYVVYASNATNLVPGDTNDTRDIFIRDRVAGTTERVNVATDGTQTVGSSYGVAVSADGRFVAFTSGASNLIAGDNNTQADVFVRDREARTTERVSVAFDGAEGNWGSFYQPGISADGRFVVFLSDASNLVAGDTNRVWDIFVRDRQLQTTERVSVSSTAGDGDFAAQYLPSISADGRYVVFTSDASNLVAADTNNQVDTFVRDRETGTTERISVGSDGSEGVARSAYGGAISADGRFVAFPTFAELDPADVNADGSVYVRDRGPQVGVGGLSAGLSPGAVTASGWATFSGATIASATDAPGDAASNGAMLGADLTGASVSYRPESSDLLVRLSVSGLPGARPTVPGWHLLPTLAGSPGVLYGFELGVGTTRYEVRVLRAAATADPPGAPLFALYRCAASCSEVARLQGGFGSERSEIQVSVPLTSLGAAEGEALGGLRAYTALGEAGPGPQQALDDVRLPDAVVPSSSVALGIAPVGASEEQVVFGTPAEMSAGIFSGTVDGTSFPAGDYELWARACLGDRCGARSAPITLT